MKHGINSVNRTIAGSVLMELIIVMPLFMLLIGGIMWIGDLILAKQRLVIADRFVAWNLGNRYPDKKYDVEDFFKDKKHQIASVNPSGGGSVDRWWHEAYAGVDFEQRMPVWTRGWIEAGEIPVDKSDVTGLSPLDRVVYYHGRDLKMSPYEGHVVIMRSGYSGTRDNEPVPDAPLNVDWESVYNEPFPQS